MPNEFDVDHPIARMQVNRLVNPPIVQNRAAWEVRLAEPRQRPLLRRRQPELEVPVMEPEPKPKKLKEKKYNQILIKIHPKILSDGPGRKKDPVIGEVGLEIETEGKNLFRSPISYWTVHNDESLRDGETGERGGRGPHPPVEYVLRKPLSREAVAKALSYLEKKLKEQGSEINKSPRTSVHVHVNMQQNTMKEIYNVICLYTILEELLVAFSGEEREGNLFCLRAKDAEYIVNILSEAARKDSYEEVFNNNWRYASCNFASLGKFGSLEFRSMRGTVDASIIQQWIDILLLIKDQALKFSNPREIVERFQRLGAFEFFQEIFTPRIDLGLLFVERNDLIPKLESGYAIVKDIAYSSPWMEPLSKTEKKEEIQDHFVRRIYDQDNNKIYIYNYNDYPVSVRFNDESYALVDRKVELYTREGERWDGWKLVEDEFPSEMTEEDEQLVVSRL